MPRPIWPVACILLLAAVAPIDLDPSVPPPVPSARSTA